MVLEDLNRVRLSGDDASAALESFIFGGVFAPPQLPRGISRAEITGFVLTRLTPDSSASAFAAVLEIMRFYELGDLASDVTTRTSGDLEHPDDVRRACAIAQIGMEFGRDDMPGRADRYLDVDVLQAPAARQALPAILEARVAVAPRGSLDRIAALIRQEHDRLEAAVEDEESLIAYDRIAAVLNNDLPKARQIVERKAEILAMDPEARHTSLTDVYLGTDSISNGETEVWAGRLLRRAVLDGSPGIVERFRAIVDAVESLNGLSDAECFLLERAANAVAYLRGGLSEKQVQMIAGIENPGTHFLCDVPVGWLERLSGASPRG